MTTLANQETASRWPAFRFRRRHGPPRDLVPQQVQPEAPVPPLMRFLTLGGAPVELRSHTFGTRYSYKGRPFAGDEPRPCDGYRWECLGCGTIGTPYGFGDHDYLDTEAAKARDDANMHASTCRAMPKPVDCLARP